MRIPSLVRRVIRERERVGKTLSDHIDRVVLSRVLGIPLFLAAMNLMFVFTINLGGAFIDLFDGVADALFVLLHFPCVATLAAIVRETGAAWASFVAFWTTSIAYIAATLFYQGATFERHPMSSAAWIAGCLILLGLVILALRGWAARGRAEVARVGGM